MEGKGEQAGEGGKSSIEGGREGRRKGKKSFAHMMREDHPTFVWAQNTGAGKVYLRIRVRLAD